MAEEKQTLYVWDLPLRISHWVNVCCIVILSVTGYYIANPFITTEGPAVSQYLMGTVSLIHYIAAFIFTVCVLFRIYWAFAGNKWARWNQFIPASRQRLRDMGRMVRYYTFLRRDPPAEIGHNPLAGATYIGLYVLFIAQIITGFALFSLPLQDGWIKIGFGWIVVLVGVQTLKLVHFLIMFLILTFTIHHVYSAVLIDIEERSGLVSSIVTGYKTLTTRQIAEAQKPDNQTSRSQQAPHMLPTERQLE